MERSEIFEAAKKRGYVLYSDFGAKGDGIHEDHEAIRAAHEFANENGFPVKADLQATYYVEKKSAAAIIKTDTDFRGATFIIDDTRLTSADTCYTFMIDSDEESFFFERGSDEVKAFNEMKDEDGIVIKGINHGDERTRKFPLALGYEAMIRVFDDDSIAYNRWGYVDSVGSAQEECFLVDKDGNIDPSTTALIDYRKVTRLLIHKTEIKPITVKNARFIGLASQMNTILTGGNLSTGIRVARPHTTVENIEHIIKNERPRSSCARYNAETDFWDDVTGEGFFFSVDTNKIYKNGEIYEGKDVLRFRGHTYTGFIAMGGTYDVLIKDCVFQARTYYNSGTYDISCYNSTHVVFENCVQSNYYDPRPRFQVYGESSYPNLSLCWGVMGSNYCKNIDFINCILTRFDAHRGVYNGRIIGGKMGVLRLIGGGEFLLDGVEIARGNGAPLQLRSDYGGTFNGTLTVRNCTFKHPAESSTGQKLPIEALIDAPTANWNNGYGNYFPNVVIDNIKIDTVQTELPLVANSKTEYNPEGTHYPIRSLLEPVHDPDAPFDVYYETRDKEVYKNHPERFKFLDGKDVTPEVIEHKNKTYTLIFRGVKNINPYHPPKFIEIKNMKGAHNANGEPLTLSLFDCDFFKNTEIFDCDSVLKRTES